MTDRLRELKQGAKPATSDSVEITINSGGKAGLAKNDGNKGMYALHCISLSLSLSLSTYLSTYLIFKIKFSNIENLFPTNRDSFFFC